VNHDGPPTGATSPAFSASTISGCRISPPIVAARPISTSVTAASSSTVGVVSVDGEPRRERHSPSQATKPVSTMNADACRAAS
jgi:hypothetical protein